MRGYPDTAILDLDNDIGRLVPDGDANRSRVRGVTDGVVKQIIHDQYHGIAIDTNQRYIKRNIHIEAEPAFGQWMLKHLHDVFNDRRDGQRLERVRIGDIGDAGGRKQVVDETSETR